LGPKVSQHSVWKIDKIPTPTKRGETVLLFSYLSFEMPKPSFGGKAGGGKASSSLKFHAKEPSFITQMKRDAGFREDRSKLRDKVRSLNRLNELK
jgi:hypothetical protein